MKRWVVPALGVALVLAVTGILYAKALFGDHLLLYRDAGHFYYPLYLKVQQEWEAGRWPLWEPEENGGMPLLGNPTSAVLYPGKILYWHRLWSYAWGSRIYTIAHNLLAVGAMYALMRHWRTSRAGSLLAALAYGFGAPILFQYCNIIFLVGAAWIPLGLRSADRWLRLGRRVAIAELAAIVALQTLGGDPQAAYLTGIAAGAYAVILALRAAKIRVRPGRLIAASLAAFLVWVGGTLAAAYVLPEFLRQKLSDRPLPKAREIVLWNPISSRPLTIPRYELLNWAGILIAAALWIGAFLWLWRRLGAGARRQFMQGLLGLAIAGGLAGAMTCAQLLPVREFTKMSLRSAPEAPHEIYPFSVLPQRTLEWLWPNVYGSGMPVNRSWIALLPPESTAKTWIPSLYVGGLTLVLALSALGFRGDSPWRPWLSALFLVSLIASLGEYGSPLWWARFSPELAALFGPHDPPETGAIRFDRFNLDGEGSPYWILTRLLPEFRSFRFPAKLLTFTCVAMAALAGLGWDRILAGLGGRARGLALALGLLSTGLVAAAWLGRPAVLDWLRAGVERSGGLFGPLDVDGAYADLRFALAQGAVVQFAAVALVVLARRRPATAGGLAAVVMAADLIVGNGPLVHTLPREILARTPEVMEVIREAEAKSPSPGPYRVHRMSIWDPIPWLEARDPARLEQLTTWEHDTLQPKYGLIDGLQYTITEGTTELYDLWFFFAPFERTLKTQDVATSLGLKIGDAVAYFPRRGFDLWNTRYFVLPTQANGWKNERRGFAAFLPDSTPIAPPPELFHDPEKSLAWGREKDWQVLRNDSAFPRAWVVHDVRVVPPLVGMRRDEREARMLELLHPGDPLWSDPSLPVYDLRKLAFVETDSGDALRARLDGRSPGPGESVVVTEYGPQEVVLDVDLERTGLVVLADVFYPGWKLTLDGAPAEILRADRLLRGALVPEGKHRLVYTYEPESFRRGLWVSMGGLAAWALVLGWGLLRPGPLPPGGPAIE